MRRMGMSAFPDPSLLSDAALRERLAYLRALEVDDEDALSGSGYRELNALEAEIDRRGAAGGICPCCRSPRTRVAPGAICAACAAFPLD